MYFKIFICISFILLSSLSALAQEKQPLTSKEVVSLLYQLERNPQMRDEIVDEIRKRGIGFQLTSGMRSLIATKSGNDAVLRRTLDEAERRRVNPAASTLPSETEGKELLERTRNVTLAAANAMPDFLVKQIIKRSVAYGATANWIPQDNLTLAVGYRANQGEEYRVLSVNGMPPADDAAKPTSDYSKYVPKGASSTGVEYISAIADVFKPESKAEFRMVDTDLIQNRRTVIYEFVVKREFSQLALSVVDTSLRTTVGSRGRMWIDRELDRVLRFEQIATEIPADFPITAATTTIDYDWVSINERKYLLPTHSQIVLTTNQPKFVFQSKNDVRFRSYQKFGAELKIIDEVGEDDEPLDEPPAKPAKPIKPPQN